MRRWMAAPTLFAAAALTLTGDTPTARAQPPGPEEVSFDTADGVRLKGLFHKGRPVDPAPKAGANDPMVPRGGPTDPVVILLYPPGVGNTMDKPGDWAGLAKTLNDKGYHVFRFDWRGHGKSSDVTDTDLFWRTGLTAPWNQKYIKPAKGKAVKNELRVKDDIVPRDLPHYLPVYVNDLAAVRMYLDQRNDQGDLNTSSIYLIGSGDAATIGTLWLTAEWHRPAIAPLLGAGVQMKVVPTNGIVADPPAGQDIAGAVWLSAARSTGIPAQSMTRWTAQYATKLREVNPMLFLYGQGDTAAAAQSDFFYKQVLVAAGNKQLGVKELEQTFIKPIPGSKLNGAALLGNDAMLGTETRITEYLAARQKDRVNKTVKKRTYVSPYFIDLSFFGIR